MNADTKTYAYVGAELDLFVKAKRWKSYLSRLIEPYLGADVLEVGAGFGGTTKFFCHGAQSRWVCLEPDAGLAARLVEAIREGALPGCCQSVVGTLETQSGWEGSFDTILYIDVLEHIEEDRGELALAARTLKPGGHLVVLSPAHPWLYTAFDSAIGHQRRYTRAMLRGLTPEGLELARLVYLDSVGLLASLGNRLLLRKAMPSSAQISLWDNVLVRLSTRLDPVLGHRLGKSVLGVWRKPPGPR